MRRLKYFIIILLLFTISCKRNVNSNIPPDDFYINLKEERTLEVYSQVSLSDFVIDTNGTLLNGADTINTSRIGHTTAIIKYKYLDKEYSEEILFEIVDTTPPLILGGSSKTLVVGYNKDLCDLIFFADNYDKKAKCTISGDYDLNKIGSYNITYNISDISNNVSTLNYKLKIIKKSNSSSTSKTPSSINFKDVLEKHKNENTEVGIDVSKWQRKIDFEKVKEDGASFVIMRIGVQKTLNGELEIDQYYYENMKNAKKAGLKVGVYLYSKATSQEEAIEHANWVIEKLNGTDLDLPIVFDWESWSIWNSLNLSLYDINLIADSYLNTVEANGYKGMLYGSKYYLQNIWKNDNNYPVWLAHYTSKTDYKGEYFIWQICDTGKINGIEGAVDINILYKEKENN